jgi:CBS domain-containing protein
MDGFLDCDVSRVMAAPVVTVSPDTTLRDRGKPFGLVATVNVRARSLPVVSDADGMMSREDI